MPDAAHHAATVATSDHLEALLEVTRIVHSDRDVRDVLPGVGEALSRAFGYGIVVLSLWRPATEDMQSVVVHGGGEAARAKEGNVTPLRIWAPLLEERFAQHGCQFIPAGSIDWANWGGEVVYPEQTTISDDPEAWDPDDALVIPLRARDGGLLGFIAVDDPASGRRPSPSDLRVLSAVGAHTSLAIEQRLTLASRTQYLAAVEELMRLSGTLTTADRMEHVLDAVLDGVKSVLGLRRVAVATLDPDAGVYGVAASTGWPAEELAWLTGASPTAVEHRLAAARQVGAAMVIEPEDLEPPEVLPIRGWGPAPWRGETLAVRMPDADGGLPRLLLAGDPVDGCLPNEPMLGALRIFADQSSLAMIAVTRLNRVRYEAAHDTLTNLGNRRSLHATLEKMADDQPPRFAVLVLDLDGFKAVNDSLGHAAGDEVLGAVGRTIRDHLRHGDEAFRLGGDEFAVVLHGASPAQAMRVRSRLESAIGSVRVRGTRVAASIGMACSSQDGHEDAETLLELADDRMYAIKQTRGRRPIADPAAR